MDFDKPVLQIVWIGKDTPYRVFLSDGNVYATNIELHMRLNAHVEQNVIGKYTVICVTKFRLSTGFLQS